MFHDIYVNLFLLFFELTQIMMNYLKSHENMIKGGKDDHHWDCKSLFKPLNIQLNHFGYTKLNYFASS
jgi:hypothetical protein